MPNYSFTKVFSMELKSIFLLCTLLQCVKCKYDWFRLKKKISLNFFMDSDILVPILLTIVGCLLMIWFFVYFGSFKLPWYVSGILLLTIFIPIGQTFALLPIDASNCIFGTTASKEHSLYLCLTSLYWISWFFGWIITPVVTSVYTYSFGFTWKSRIWYSIRYNILWYVWAAVIIVVGVFALMISGKLKGSNLIPMVMAMSNAYGLLLLCLLLGYGFVELPRTLWKLADAKKLVSMHILNIENEADEVAKSLTDGRILLDRFEDSMSSVLRQYKDIYLENMMPRHDKLKDLLEKNIFHNENICRNLEPSKTAKRVQNFNFSKAYTDDLESFLKDADEIIVRLATAQQFIISSADGAEKGLMICNSKAKSTMRLIFMRILAVIVGLLCIVSFWGEATIMFKPKWSVFHILSHLHVPKWVHELCITAPIILFLVCVGSWSLTKVHVGDYFRLIKGASNDMTFYFFTVILCRLAPTIGYHYLMQLGCDNSMTMKVFLSTKDVFFFGTYWTVFSPILMILIGVLVLFNVWDSLLFSLGIHKFTFDDTLAKLNERAEAKGKDILVDMRPRLAPYVGVEVSRESMNNYIDQTPLDYGW